jgi:hypothetical protein
MALRTSTAHKNKLLGTSPFTTLYNGGVILLYSGTQPTTADSAATGTILGIISLNSGWTGTDPTAAITTAGLTWGTPSGGAIGIATSAVWSCTAIGTGTVGWFRIRQAAADTMANDTSFIYPRIDGAVGTTTGELQLTVVNLVTGVTPTTIQSASFALS